MIPDFSKVKILTFPLKGCIKPYDICNVFAHFSIDKYIYEIKCQNRTIKFGKSTDNNYSFGERIYRQIGHLDSWGEHKIKGPNGSEFLEINEEYLARYKEDMDHNDMSIVVWSLDDYEFIFADPSVDVYKIEQYLIEQYSNTYGRLPIGNKNDMKGVKNKFAVPATVFQFFRKK